MIDTAKTFPMRPTRLQLVAKAFGMSLAILVFCGVALAWLQYSDGQALKDYQEKQQKTYSELKLVSALSLAVLCIDSIKPDAKPEPAKHATSHCDAAKAEYEPALKAYEYGANFDARLKGVAW